jgi:thioesterase domain-containing protein
VQPHGPYYLGGRSLGGVIGEMARQLTDAGENVVVMLALDSGLPACRATATCRPDSSATRPARWPAAAGPGRRRFRGLHRNALEALALDVVDKAGPGRPASGTS